MEADGPDAARLTDRIDYELPLGFFGRLAAGWLVRRRLERMFEFRHRTTREAMEGGRG